MKVNALEDVDICTALYRAARAGVQVDLVVRDTCRVRPGIPGLSESMRVVSVVGRFLEHSRIYHFRNGGEEEYYIGSADCMKRNLESRVEALVPVEAEALRAELDSILTAALRDNRRAWDMRADGSYVQRRAAEGEKELDSQQQFIEYAEKRWKDANRLKRRKTRVIQQRTVRTEPR